MAERREKWTGGITARDTRRVYRRVSYKATYGREDQEGRRVKEDSVRVAKKIYREATTVSIEIEENLIGKVETSQSRKITYARTAETIKAKKRK